MIGRIAWIALLVLVAGATAALQLDRQSRYQPAFAALVPEPFSAFALPHKAAAAIDAGESERGLALAERLVARRPMPALHLRLLGQAQIAADNPQAASLAVQYAARRGWRDEPAQEVMLQIALGAGDRPEAARRFAALFISPRADQNQLVSLGQQVFADPGGGEAEMVFAGIVAGTQRWHGTYLRKGSRFLPPESFAAITIQAARAGARFECKALDAAGKVKSFAANAQAAQELQALIERQC
jgi:hypothetical protein